MDECKLILEALKAEQQKTNELLLILCNFLGADTSNVSGVANG